MDDQTPPSGEGPKPTAGESKSPPGVIEAGESAGPAGERIQAIIQAAEKAAAGIIEDADAQARHYIDSSRQRADALADERVRVMSDLTETLVRQAELVRRQSDELLSALDTARDQLAGHIGHELAQGGPPAGLAPQALPAPAESPAPAEPPAPAEQPASEPPPGGSRVPRLQPVESKPPDLKPVESPPPVEAVEPEPPTENAEPSPESAQAPSVESVSKPPPPPPPPQPIASSGSAALPSDGARLLAAQMAVAGSSREEIEARLRQEFDIEDAGPILDGILGPG